MKENLKAMPKIVRADRRFRQYLLARSYIIGIYIMLPFLAIYVLRILDKPDSFLGLLVTSQMAGGILGNVLAGVVGDRQGGKNVMFFSNIIYLVVCVWAIVAHSEIAFISIFFLLGTAFYASQVGLVTLSFEVSPFEKRSTYLAIVAFMNLPVQLVCSAISAFLWTWLGNFSLLAFISALTIVFSTVSLSRLRKARM